MLTMAQAQAARELAEGGRVSTSRQQDLREALRDVKFYRSKPHEERKVRWRELGLNNATGRKAASIKDSARSLRALADKLSEKVKELEVRCNK